jgi:hypothetical protein
MYKGAQIENGLSKWALVSGGDEAWSVSWIQLRLHITDVANKA